MSVSACVTVRDGWMVGGPVSDGREGGKSRAQGGVERAVRSELRSLGVSVQTSGLPALAVSLAQHIDSSRGAVAAAAAAAQLRLILADGAGGAEAPRER